MCAVLTAISAAFDGALLSAISSALWAAVLPTFSAPYYAAYCAAESAPHRSTKFETQRQTDVPAKPTANDCSKCAAIVPAQCSTIDAADRRTVRSTVSPTKQPAERSTLKAAHEQSVVATDGATHR
jgi:hypothetical protein